MPISVVECLAGRDLTEPRLSPDGRLLGYVRTDADGSRLVVKNLAEFVDDGATDAPTIGRVEWTSPWTVRAGRSLGGGCFEWMPDSASLVAITAEGDMKRWRLDGFDEVVVRRPNGRSITSPAPDVRGERIAYVVDQAEVHEVELSSRRGRRVDGGEFGFVFDPVWWRNELVWQAWSPPHMPWDRSALVSREGILYDADDVQHQQPQTSIDGERLGWLDDRSGWLNLVVRDEGRIEETFEHGGPTWGERQRSWCFAPDSRRVAFVRNESGFGRLCTVDPATGIVEEKAKAVHGQLSWRGHVLAAIRTGGRTPTQVVVYDTSDDEWKRTTIEIGSSHAWSDSDALVEPELLRVDPDDSHGIELHARLYRSIRPNGRLLCWIHGGPTDQWQVVFMPRLAFWIDRGYDVLVPDFRGSTGHGRAYTQALREEWGVVDVADVERILTDVAARYGYSTTSTALLGSSAGGLTALALAARRPDIAAAVVASYPVSDIAGLEDTTHRFESHYNRTLVGTVDETTGRSARRSPAAHAEALNGIPLLVFHGTDDPVVPIGQSRRLVEDVRSHGGRAELVEFEGEGHGFRSLENKTEEFTRTETFLERHLVAGFES